MIAGAAAVALTAGEERAEAPTFRIAHARAAAIAPVPPRAVDVRLPREGRSLKLHLAHGNDETYKNAWVYVPRSFDPRGKPLRLAVLFHGFHNCLDSYVSAGGRICTPGQPQRTGYDIAAQVEKSGTRALFVVPQLAYDAPSSDPGKLGKMGGMKRFVKELVEEALVSEIGPHTYEDVERVMLLASSGGYQGLVPALANGQIERVRDVYLLDAFYVDTSALNTFVRAHPEDFRPDSADPRHFGLVFCKKSGTASQSREFGWRLGTFMHHQGNAPYYAFEGWSAHPGLDDLRVPAFVYMSHLEHDQVVSEYLWQLLAASGI